MGMELGIRNWELGTGRTRRLIYSACIRGICARGYFLQINVSFRGDPRIGTTRNPLVNQKCEPKNLQGIPGMKGPMGKDHPALLTDFTGKWLGIVQWHGSLDTPRLAAGHSRSGLCSFIAAGTNSTSYFSKIIFRTKLKCGVCMR